MDDASAIRLAKTIGHPIRFDMLDRIRAAGKISPRRYAKASGESLGNSSYHAIVLKEAGILQVEPNKADKGAIENFYGLTGPQAPTALALLDFLRGL